MRGYLKVSPSWSDGPIPWPRRYRTGSIILCGDLVRAHIAKEAIIAWDFGSRIGPELKTETLRDIHICALDLTDLFRVTLRPESSLMLIWRRSCYCGPN